MVRCGAPEEYCLIFTQIDSELVQLRGWIIQPGCHPEMFTLVICHSINTSTDFAKKKKRETGVEVATNWKPAEPTPKPTPKPTSIPAHATTGSSGRTYSNHPPHHKC